MNRVEWSAEAQKDFQERLRYIADGYGRKAARKFEANIAQWEKLIAQNPAIGSKEPLLQELKKEYRSIVTHKYCKLIYLVKEDCIYIAALWDTRREPHIQAGNTK